MGFFWIIGVVVIGYDVDVGVDVGKYLVYDMVFVLLLFVCDGGFCKGCF